MEYEVDGDLIVAYSKPCYLLKGDYNIRVRNPERLTLAKPLNSGRFFCPRLLAAYLLPVLGEGPSRDISQHMRRWGYIGFI